MTKYIAHITMETETPLKVGSNANDFIQDSPIQKDFNSLAMILGTSIAGVLRKNFDKNIVDDVFGKENGSKIIISNALLLDENNQVSEKLLLNKSNFLKLFETLAIREHTAITDKGTARKHSKFDEEVLYKGARFKFSIELSQSNEDVFHKVLDLISLNSFRLGGGSTKGFGKMKILNIKTESFDNENYKDYSSSLNFDLKNTHQVKNKNDDNYINYTLKIKADDFFMFGSGFGDKDADMTPVYEKTIDYDKKALSNKMILIPASSIKGAISHRATYYYNLGEKYFIGNDEAIKSIKEIFGEAKQSDDNLGFMGRVIFSDCFVDDSKMTKVFDHVSIDRFTSGGINGALFQEKTISDNKEYEIEILLEKGIEAKYIKAFELAIKDITTGMLSLGGATTKGHGIFHGVYYKDGVLND